MLLFTVGILSPEKTAVYYIFNTSAMKELFMRVLFRSTSICHFGEIK